MLRRFAILIGSLGLLAGAAAAANLPLLSGPNYSDPSQVLPTVNNVIQSINLGTTGNVAAIPAVTGYTGTITTFASYTIPTPTSVAGVVVGGAYLPGQTFHIKVWGSNASGGGAKTLTLSFGGSTDAITLTGASEKWICDFYSNNQTATAVSPATPVTAAEAEVSTCSQGTVGLVGPVQNAWTVANNAAISVLLEETSASDNMTIAGGYMEILR